MLTVVLVTLAVPIAAVAAGLAARHKQPRLVADTRGIALQTVIIIVVLLAIAGGVATVLLATGGDAIDDIPDDLSRPASEYKNKILCENAGHTWTAASKTCS